MSVFFLPPHSFLYESHGSKNSMLLYNESCIYRTMLLVSFGFLIYQEPLLASTVRSLQPVSWNLIVSPENALVSMPMPLHYFLAESISLYKVSSGICLYHIIFTLSLTFVWVRETLLLFIYQNFSTFEIIQYAWFIMHPTSKNILCSLI